MDSAPAPEATVEAVIDASPPAAPRERWQDALREDRYADALELLGPSKPDDPPTTRLARARAAVESGDGATALASCADLEAALPLLADDVARLRARAKALVGPFAEAGDWFAGKPGVADQLAAARAYESAKDATKAVAAVAHVLSASTHTRRQEAEARALRIRVSGNGADMVADARWLQVRGADFACAADAKPVLDAQQIALTPPEQLERARVLADAGKLELAVAAFDAGQHKIKENLGREKGELLMRARGRYNEAADYFYKSYESTHSAEALVSSARALSRDNKDEDAVARYDEVIKVFPHAPQADDAAFLAARLVLLHGRWADACKRLDEYASKYTHEKKEASRLRAIAHLENGDVKLARKLLEEAAGAEKDDVASARLQVLAASAALADGDKTHALARWTDVATTLPLSWPALMARAHLAAAGAPLPAMIEASAPPTAAPAMTIALPAPVDALHAAGLDDDAERALRAREPAVASAWPTRADEALCTAYGVIDRGNRRYQLSSAVPKLALSTAPSVSNRWAWECVYPAPFSGLVSRLESDEQLPVGLVHAVMRQESGFDPDVVSPARAIGLMQLMPETASTLALELPGKLTTEDGVFAPGVNIRFGARYLRNMLARLRSVPLAVAAYNAGPDAIDRWSLGMSPPSGGHVEVDAFVEMIPYAETRNYVVRVMGSMARYGYLAKGEDGVPKIDLAL